MGGERTERVGARAAGPRVARRHPPPVRRRLIVEAARTVMARRGMAATGMREVAAAAGVSLGTVTYHFSGVDELLVKVIDAEEAEFFLPLVDHALAAETGRSGLQYLVDGLLSDEPRTREHWLLWLDFWTLASRDVQFGQWQLGSYEAWRKVVAELVERGQADGSLVVTDTERAVSHVMALVDGVAAQAFLVGRGAALASGGPRILMRSLLGDLFAYTDDAAAGSAPAPSSESRS